jgi:hypothetical protein
LLSPMFESYMAMAPRLVQFAATNG